MTKVTIAIPTYNRADSYFKPALESALAQTYKDLEIIVGDNGSTDHTADLVRSYQDDRICYFRQTQNIDPNDNFNFCLQQARGEYFLLLHDDDVIDSDFVECCMQHIEKENKPVGVIRTGTRVIDENGRTTKENINHVDASDISQLAQAWFGHKTALYLCSTLYNTKILQQNGGFRTPYNLFQDVVAIVNLVAAAGHRGIPEIKASFRRHGSNRGSSVKVKQWCADCRYLLDIICKIAPARAADLLHEGEPYMANKCYGKAAGINELFTRLGAYAMVYRFFNYRLSPKETIRRNDWPKLKKYLRIG
jgi:glycosyltransferase involved in cell wall biosynthesis